MQGFAMRLIRFSMVIALSALFLNCASEDNCPDCPPGGNSSNWQPQNSGVSVDLRDVVWNPQAPSTQFIAVGDHGTILTSADGSAWTKRNSPTDINLFSVDFAYQQLVTVGDSGTIITSPDGINWVSQLSPTKLALHTVASSSGGTVCVAAGDSSAILTSTNSGNSWQSQNTLQTKTQLLAATYCVQYSSFWIVGASGRIHYSNGLTSWESVNEDIFKTLRAALCVFDLDTTIVIAGDDGILMRSDKNEGFVASFPTTRTIRGLDSYQPGKYCLVGDGGLVMLSDNLTDWSADPTGRNERLNAVASYYVSGADAHATLVAVGTGGLILKRTIQ